MNRAPFCVSLFVLCGLAAPTTVKAEIGVTDQQIVVGSVGAVRVGNRDGYTAWISTGADALFKQVNAKGGINGRTIKYIVEDDGYEPENTVRLAKELVEEAKVFTLIGGNGTPNIKAMLPYLQRTKTPLLFPFTGGEFLYDPVIPNIFTIHLSAAEEAKQLIDFAVGTLGKKNVGVLSQEDALGTAGRSGVAKALAGYNLTIKADGTYKRNSTDIASAFANLTKTKPEVIYLASTLHATAAFLKKCAAENYRPIFLVQSSVGPIQDLEKMMDFLDLELYTVEILPSTKNTAVPLIAKFKVDMKAAGHEDLAQSAFALEGYAGAAIFVNALEKMGKDVTRDRLRETLESMKNTDIQGLKVTFTPKNHHGLSQVLVYKTTGHTTKEEKVAYVK